MSQPHATSTTLAHQEEPLGVTRLRQDFPALHQQIDGKPLIYLDNASSAHKPRAMIDCISACYAHDYAKLRAPHALGQRVTAAYEEARAATATLINAADPKEIVFVRGATEALNIVANGFGRSVLQPGDEVLLTVMEHHANIVPWLMACEQTGATVRVASIDEAGNLDLDRVAGLLSERTKVLSVAHVSNVLGTIYPIKSLVDLAHARGIPVVVDGAQGAPHLPVDVREMGCDFYAFSCHKMYGPSGLGVLYGQAEWLQKLPPLQGGSPMAQTVTFAGWAPKELPTKFEAGVPAIAETVAFTPTIAYLADVGMERIAAYERELVAYASARLGAIERVRVLGAGSERVSVLSFTLDGIAPQNAGRFLDQEMGIAVRTGALSAQPLMAFLGIPGAVRASFALYNTRAEADALAEGVERCLKTLG